MARPPNVTSERFEIHPGAPVVSGNDEVGKVDGMIVRPDSREVEAILVRKGIVLHRDVAIPIEAVDTSCG